MRLISQRAQLCASASVLALTLSWAASAPAYAQADPSATVETVVVTGFRHSIETSEMIKRQSSQIVEAISAEDIGKLPDLSIADSLARLPGLAAQRVDGRAQVVAIRGLSPDFAGTTLNGRDQVSTGDNRGVEFDQYPAEILTGAVVYKTADVSLVGQGLSGTIDLRSARPLDYDGRQVAFGARGEYNTLGNATHSVSPFGNRFNLTYIDQFLNHTLGVAIGFAHLDSPFQEQHYKAWWWANTDPWGAPQVGKPSDATTLEGAEVWARAKSQVRDGTIATVEFEPNGHFHSTLDLYYSNFDQKEYMNGIMWTDDPWTSYNGNYIGYNNVGTTVVQGTKLVTTGAWFNLRPVVRNDYNTRTDVLSSVGWNNVFTAGKWIFKTDLSYSGAKRNERQIETYAGSQTLDSNFAFVIPVTPAFPKFTPGMSYSDPTTIQLFDAQVWGHDGRIGVPRQKDTIEAARIDLQRDIDSGIFSSVEVGVNFETRQKKRTYTVYFANLLNNRAPVSVSSDLLNNPVSLSFAGIPGVMSDNVLGALNKYYVQTLSMSANDYNKDFTVKEKVLTSYAKIDIDTDVYGVKLRGNVGAQLVHTDQWSDAYDIDQSTSSPVGNVASGKSYYDFLPSINLVADFGDGNIVRMGLAKTMARPRVDDERAAGTVGVDVTTRLWSGSGGNPKLSPWRADAVDLTYEHYFNGTSYVAVAGFYKNLTSYIYTQNVQHDFTGYVNTTAVTPVSNIGMYSTPANGKGGYLRGVEFSTALDGTLFSGALDGFGTLLSFSWTDTSIKPDGPGTSLTATLPGLSKAVADATFYYEKGGFSFRIGEQYRSDFRGEINYLFADRVYTRILGEAQTNLQVSYEFQEGQFQGLSLLAQVNNLTNSPYRTVQDSNFSGGTGGARAPLEYDVYGTQVLFGLNYKL
ncbi:MAG: TonB-dependent receptor [Alphaproteobacteria bacterium]|nr:TonB-dependent receptor [Alphaproteobacteria bacterium]